MSDSKKLSSIEEYVIELRKRDLSRGILRVNNEIYDGTSNVWLQEIDALREDPDVHEVLVKITCPGGSAYCALGLYDALRELRAAGKHVTAKVEGYAASAAATFILQAADWRTAGPTSRILVHEVRGSASGRASDIEDDRAEMYALADIQHEILTQRTGHDAEFWREKTNRREKWFSAQEALEVGLLDEIR